MFLYLQAFSMCYENGLDILSSIFVLFLADLCYQFLGKNEKIYLFSSLRYFVHLKPGYACGTDSNFWPVLRVQADLEVG